MTQIVTYLFIDLQATDLPDKEDNQTKITELSLAAVSRKHLLATRRGEAPRVQRKLTLCFNPEPGSPIGPVVKCFSGLSNTLLEEEPTFGGETCRILEMFIDHLNKPICLVSHGGNFLDFPLLKKQLVQANVCLPADLRYVDSLDVFYCVMEGVDAASTFPHVKIRLRRSYKLKDVYRRLMSRTPPEIPHADAKCQLTVTCAVALADKFVDWVDAHSKLFSEQKPLGKPLTLNIYGRFLFSNKIIKHVFVHI